LRKTPTLLVGLLATGAIAGTAAAQTIGSHTLNVGLSPSKAGTKKKPKNVTVRLAIANNREAGTTAKNIRIDLPSGLRMNTKGFQVCSEEMINEEGADKCPKESRLGRGTAAAVVNPTAADPTEITFQNSFYVGGKDLVNIYLIQKPGEVRAVLQGKIQRGGRRLSIDIPEDLQQPAPGVYSALTDIKTTLKGTTGSGSKKHGFFELSKCRNNAVKVSTVLSYAPNPEAPVRPNSKATDSTPCKS